MDARSEEPSGPGNPEGRLKPVCSRQEVTELSVSCSVADGTVPQDPQKASENGGI